MELSQVESLIADPNQLYQKLLSEKGDRTAIEKLVKLLDPKNHDVADSGKRPDKTVTTDNGTSVVPVARLAISMQKKIVNYAAHFLCGTPVQISCSPANDTEENLLEVIKKTWDDNKLRYKTKDLAKKYMAETEAAELWYLDDADSTFWKGTPNDLPSVKFKLRMRVLAQSLGDTLLPTFSTSGDLVAFGRYYSIMVDGKSQNHLDIYTEKFIYNFVQTSEGWSNGDAKANVIGKIPVVYYSQPLPEWADVQTLIDRWELSLSKHADTNDYFGSPIVKVKGDVSGFAKKGEDGKVLQLTGPDASAEYLTWNQSPESVKLEQENLRSLIYDLTDTPDISFQQMKGLGTYSGFAIKMLFTAAHLKAADKEIVFGEGVQRRLNYIKAAMTKINVKLEPALVMNLEPTFTYFLPTNETEDIDNLVTAKNGGIISQETAIEKNPLVTDPDQEKERIKNEKDAADQSAAELDKLNNDPNNQ